MSPTKKLPLVAICGRPNVGKSTLFNRIIGKQRAIVHSEEGITRDRTYGTAEWEGRRFRVVDTGGVVENPIDPITRKMQEQVRAALDEAKVIVFVVDGRQELTRVDEELREQLFRYGKPVVLAVNKLDNARLFKSGLLAVADAASVARYGIAAMEAGKRVAIPGLRNRLAARSAAFTPRVIALAVARFLQSDRKAA